MSLKEKINLDYMSSFKNRDLISKNLLSVIKGEIQTTEKNLKIDSLSDDEVIKILNKTIKALKETISLLDKNGEDRSKNNFIKEVELIQSYLPKNLTNDEISSIIDNLIDSGFNNIGLIMKEFSNLPADKKVVSTIFKNKMEAR